LPRRDHHDLAALLLRKAAGDEAAVAVLSTDATVPDEVVGFHAQQAVEKLLKAVLAALDREFPRTHDLGMLQTLLEDAGHPLPDRLQAVEELTLWAVQFRYEDVLDAGLDRAGTLRLVIAVREWAVARVEP
jgi:HEPN domain-containing protein